MFKLFHTCLCVSICKMENISESGVLLTIYLQYSIEIYVLNLSLVYLAIENHKQRKLVNGSWTQDHNILSTYFLHTLFWN